MKQKAKLTYTGRDHWLTRCVRGDIYDDEAGRFQDGTDVRTSYVERIYIAKDEWPVIETRNTLYYVDNLTEEEASKLALELDVLFQYEGIDKSPIS
jgi:hypothetical protein